MVEYVDTANSVTPEMLHGFFEGWKKPRTPDEHLRILQNSEEIVLAIDTEAKSVVGFIAAHTDGLQSAYISLLEVLPAYRRRGIGGELVRRMLERLKRFPAIDLTCDPPVQRFYAKFGMVPTVGMALRNY